MAKKKSSISIIPPKSKEQKPSILKRFFSSVWGIVGVIATIGGAIAFIIWIYDIYNIPKEQANKAYEKNTGTLKPRNVKRQVLAWPLGFGIAYFKDGVMDLSTWIPPGIGLKSRKPFTEPPFKGVDFKAWVDNYGIIKVNTHIFDTSGRLVAEMIENEWQVNIPNYAYKRNFNDTSLEVIDHSDKVVFQIDISGNLIFLRGIFNRPDSLVVEVNIFNEKITHDPNALGVISLFNKKYYRDITSAKQFEIRRIFKYPSDIYRGVRVQDTVEQKPLQMPKEKNL